jgi:serine/threonine protein kinase
MAIHVSIEGYDSLEQIGVGGMAAVYRARKMSIDKVVAIKVLFPYLASDESFIERFQREAKAAARIQHENIVNVIDFGESGGAYYIVMEYYEGKTLEEILKSRNELPLDIAVQILLEVCFGLDSAHGQNTIHRDIKPGNIIFTKQGGVKIADFGLAKKSDATSMITQEGKVIGTPAYMSPEQAAGRDVGPQSDIFSLGVVAYELLGQQKPFEGKSYSEVLEKIQTFEPLSVSEVNPLVQPDFETIVSKMLEKDLDKRHQSVREVIADVEKAMEKFRLTRDRRRLVSYINDPEAYENAYKEKLINRCLSQGAFYMKKGESHLDDAILEFKRILHLDPDNERARKNLDRIRATRDKDKTVTVVTPARPATKQNEEEEKKKKKHKSVTVVAASGRSHRRGAGKAIGLSVAAAVLVAVSGWFAFHRGYLSFQMLNRSGNSAPVLSAPKHMTVRSGERIAFTLQAADADSDTVRFYSDELPHGAKLDESGEFTWKVDYNQAGEYKVTFYADDGVSASLSETVIEVKRAELALNFRRIGTVRVDAGKPFNQRLRAKSTSGKAVKYSLEKAPDGMQIKKGQLIWDPKAELKGTFEAVVKASDGYVTEKQTVVLTVRSVDEQEAELAQIDWKLPERANVFVDGDLTESETRRFTTGLPKGPHTLRAELMDGTTGWIETLDLTPGETVKLQAQKLEFGKLSVYFLGGVGEFRVNGKLFKEQPPFSGVSVPIGTHRVSCRMANESDSKEFTVSVEKGRETIIEYEIGSEPVVTLE